MRPQVEELAPPTHALYVREQQLEVVGVVDEVQALAVDDEQRRIIVLIEVPAVRVGQASAGAERFDASGRVIMPGFVDAHIHYPQTDVVAAWGSQLLDWLNTHTFPAEQAFGNVSAVATDSQDRVYVFQRKDPPVLIASDTLVVRPEGLFPANRR